MSNLEDKAWYLIEDRQLILLLVDQLKVPRLSNELTDELLENKINKGKIEILFEYITTLKKENVELKQKIEENSLFKF